MFSPGMQENNAKAKARGGLTLLVFLAACSGYAFPQKYFAAIEPHLYSVRICISECEQSSLTGHIRPTFYSWY